jgi:NADH-quinone oxidoreductase subunit J
MQIALILLSLLSVVSACGVVFSRQAVNSALCLTGNLLGMAVLYLCMSLQFLAVAQLVIYAGAIMVVFLFAVTLLAPAEEGKLNLSEGPRVFGILTGGFVATGLVVAAQSAPVSEYSSSQPPLHINEFAVLLFGRYVLPFECTAFVLLVALIGAVLLGHRRLKARDSQQEVRHD